MLEISTVQPTTNNLFFRSSPDQSHPINSAGNNEDRVLSLLLRKHPQHTCLATSGCQLVDASSLRHFRVFDTFVLRLVLTPFAQTQLPVPSQFPSLENSFIITSRFSVSCPFMGASAFSAKISVTTPLVPSALVDATYICALSLPRSVLPSH